MKKLALVLPILALSGTAQAQATLSESDILASIDGRYEQLADTARTIWELAEVGYQEEKSSELLKQNLRAQGFSIKSGVAGIPTAFVAEYGTDGPVIGILAEYDALPGINQDALAVRSPIAGKNASHACGHNLFAAGSVEAAIAVRKWLKETRTPGRIRLYGTPAEEGGSGKVYMVREGLFDDVDFAIHWHAADENSAAARTTLANRSAKFRFRGVSAHAAGAPDRARSALDGVEAFNMMVNMMREHVPQDSRIHYVITEGGTAPNVVPDFAEVFYYVRHPDPDGVEAIWSRVEEAARGAALGTGTTVDWEVIHGNNPLLVNEPMARMMDSKLRQLGGITYSAEEQKFAETIHAGFDKPKNALGSQAMIQPYDVTLGYGSTDVGDVSFATPTVGVRTATWVPGTSAHSWQSSAASGMSIGFKGTELAAKAMTLAAIELYTNPDLRSEARAAFDEARGPDYVYKSLLGDRKPPLNYRK
ncbi:aminobenzoyl-glutamate utilization protein B [Parasphingorhabdus marina DSM 22363]|uniref:Aminobenzoyl-glutamate utilization protein B n=1 Tax=Parasphingorhabdus marina DSM 22363 TaxID=1123272 RepID=A0A1N6D681_9SPHN|nr:amidohydrolase [Parasphingorhabdus marina]SIN66328.1 aminobenzoyl-glutamate utilization protein B [Parasphingorhabdus marina DSM 22363]